MQKKGGGGLICLTMPNYACMCDFNLMFSLVL